MERDTHPALQFLKYGFCGAGAFVTHQLVWLACATWVFPALSSDLPDETRALNSTLSNGIAFVFSNTFAYVTNVLWVFTSGRHSRLWEFLYFTMVSSISFAGGLAAGPVLIALLGINSFVAQFTMAFTAAMINFICRKFFVFKG
jgi:putative flippase GtrA